MKHSIIVFNLYFLAYYFVYGLEFVPEIPKITYTDKRYLPQASASVRRLGRHGRYVLNINATVAYTVSSNVSMHFIFYEYLHNEFKRSFVEMKFNYCDFATKDRLFSPLARRVGMTCPLYAGTYKFHNLSMVSIPAVDNMPYKWPFKRAKVVLTLTAIPAKVMFMEGYLIASFKQSNS